MLWPVECWHNILQENPKLYQNDILDHCNLSYIKNLHESVSCDDWADGPAAFSSSELQIFAHFHMHDHPDVRRRAQCGPNLFIMAYL